MSHHEVEARVIQVPKVVDAGDGRYLCSLTDIEDGSAIAVDCVLEDAAETLVVVRHGARAYAYRNVCPHAGRRLDWAPGRFLLAAGVLVCAVHGASFVSDSGLCIGGPCRGASLSTVPVCVIDGAVLLVTDPRPQTHV